MKAKPFWLRDLPWKAVAVLTATVMWVMTVGEADVTTSISAPLQLLNTPPNLEISSTLPTQIRLDIRGRSGRMTPTELAGVAVVIDLADSRPGERTIPLDSTNVTLPDTVTLERAQPSELSLRLEQRIRREVPVVARIGTPPPQEWEVAEVNVMPAKVSLSGAASHMVNVAGAETEPLDLSQLSGDATLEAHALVGDATVRFDSGSRVQVKVKLRKKQ